MANNSLYRQYRPDTFDKVIGQDHIIRTLKNQIMRGKVGHAYLFTGTRGTGKTSTAKIFARAVNCLSPVDGSPCGKCVNCIELSRSTNMDIVEIDAASNTGVNDIRDLREKTAFRPAIGSKKVYIIDEVHMLSDQAFNALLKTLEEPPEHIIFILATTEVQKIPATILSRCLRFDFRLIPQELIAAQIAKIFDESGIKYETAAVNLIAQSGNGSDRDALSLADMCISYSDDNVTYENVLEVLGSSDPTALLDLTDAIFAGDTGVALSKISDIVALGKNMSVLSLDISTIVRNAVLIKTSSAGNELLKLPQKQFEKLQAIANHTPIRHLVRVLDMFSVLDGELRFSSQPRILFEAAVVRASEGMQQSSLVEELEKRVTALEQGSGQKKNDQVEEDSFDESVTLLSDSERKNAASVWQAASDLINSSRNIMLHLAMDSLKPYADGDKLVVELDEGSQLLRPQNRALVLRALTAVGSELQLEFVLKDRTGLNTLVGKLTEDFNGSITIKN